MPNVINAPDSASAPRTYGRDDSIPSSEYGNLFRDAGGSTYLIVEALETYGQPAKVRPSHLDLDCRYGIAWPLTPAPLGTSITITNED